MVNVSATLYFADHALGRITKYTNNKVFLWGTLHTLSGWHEPLVKVARCIKLDRYLTIICKRRRE